MIADNVLRLCAKHLYQMIQGLNKYSSDNVLGLSDHPNVLPRSYDFYFTFGTIPISWEDEPNE